MENLTLEDISIGMHFKSLNPIKRGDGIEFPKGSYFRVTEIVFNGAYKDEQRYRVTLQCIQEGPQRMALAVQTPKHRMQSGHMRELGLRSHDSTLSLKYLTTLNSQGEKEGNK